MPPPAREMIFYDGHCGLCHRTVKFVLARDAGPAPAFDFAPLDSEAFRAAVPEATRRGLPDSVIVRTADGRLLARSAAVLHILSRLGGPWPAWARLGRVIPRPLRDASYRLVAFTRRRLFAPPEGACPLTPPELRVRFHV